jgi:creatinine amidohydrolase
MTVPAASPHGILLEHLTRDEVRQMASSTTVVVPTGSTEQHSTHLPLSVDTVMASEVAARAARLLLDDGEAITVAPAVPYGFSHHHFPVGGAVSIGITVYIDFMSEVVRSLSRLGFPRVVFVNGHGGNDEALRVVANRIVFEDRLPVAVAVASYWDVGREALADEEIQQVGPVPGHAGGFETSCMLAVRPELVRLDRRPSDLDGLQPLATLDRTMGGMVRRPGVWEASHGCTDAAAADPARGARAVERVTRAVVEFIHTFIHVDLLEVAASTNARPEC